MTSISKLFAAWRPKLPDSHDEQAAKQIFALPLTPTEMLVVMRCLHTADESERTNPNDKQTIGLILDRIGRFAERQGAWWDVDGDLVATTTRTFSAPQAPK